MEKNPEVTLALDKYDGTTIKFALNGKGTKVVMIHTYAELNKDFVGLLTLSPTTGSVSGRYSMNFTFDEWKVLMDAAPSIARAISKFTPARKQYPKFESDQDLASLHVWVVKKNDIIARKGSKTWYTVMDALEDGKTSNNELALDEVLTTESMLGPTWDVFEMVQHSFYFLVLTRMFIYARKIMCKGCEKKSGLAVDHNCLTPPANFGVYEHIMNDTLIDAAGKVGNKMLSVLIDEIRKMTGAGVVWNSLLAQCVRHFTCVEADIVRQKIWAFWTLANDEKRLIERAYLRTMIIRGGPAQDQGHTAEAAGADLSGEPSAKQIRL